MDPRSKSVKYTIDDLIWSVILMFILRVGSRNAMNNLRKKEFIHDSVQKLFGLKLPHFDSCHDALKQINSDDLKVILVRIISFFVKNKLFVSAKNFNNISILFDGTGIGSIDVEEKDLIPKPEDSNDLMSKYVTSLFPIEENSTSNPSDVKMNTCVWATGKTSKNGLRYFSRQLLILRMIAPNGMSIVVDWEPINTEDGSKKEDCEQNAAKRLLARFKQNFKRLQVTLIGDGLFANQTFMKLAEDYDLKFIYTLTNDSLKNTWKEIKRIKDLNTEQNKFSLFKDDYGKKSTQITVPKIAGGSDIFFREYEWINGLQHKDSSFSWCSLAEYIDEKNKFYFSVITNLPANEVNICNLLHTARERALIEDGFNTLKNRGFALEHKYSKTSDIAAMNYITLMGISDIISNLVFLSDFVQRTYFRDNKQTIISIVDDIRSKLKSHIDSNFLEILKTHIPQNITYTMPKLI